MKKELLTTDNIKHDLLLSIQANYANKSEWRIETAFAITLLAVITGFLLKNIWIGLAIFAPAVYLAVRYIIAEKKFKSEIRAAEDAVNREEFIISLETLDKVREETIYEPHSGYRGKTHLTKDVCFFYFVSGIKWRMPRIAKHYEWSKEYYISSAGLNNTSVSGNEFYFVKLESDTKISYIYNTKFFELENY
jgi:hypothetical protein